ncbi:urease accessory protein UreD [Cephaloticoccus primus]|uniref:Urease accessory protein UreD n=1 Tax=Cephaloticoccus primus TaxID=1548207 RepID=A0A139SSV7_9BACT|nr:urease accessory protein UreD [Cephaloticoccus primus]KXU37540.1 urease accessory protein UreD [Cephaloticoccus primus]
MPTNFFSRPLQSRDSGWRARLGLEFVRRGARSVLVRNRHVGPLRLQKPLYPEGEAVCHAIVLHPPAGIVGGDSLEIAVDVGAGAHALLTTPGAGKWYRSAGQEKQRESPPAPQVPRAPSAPRAPLAALVQTIRVAADALCEWLPQESLVFDGAVGTQTTEVELAPGAHFIGLEMLCFGRTASGERFARGDFSMSTRIGCGARLLWRERGRVTGSSPLLDSPVGLGGAPVAGTLCVIGPRVGESLRDACCAIAPELGAGAVTLLPGGVLLARWLGPVCEPGRAWFTRLWAVVRPALSGRPALIPRIWNT